MRSFIKEPLFHFLLLGAVLFLISNWTAGDEKDETEVKRIIVSAGQTRTLIEQFRKVWQRPPTPQETRSLIDSHVREEIMYRQALALGLDQNDGIIRRRLQQKLEFISEDIADLIEPSDEELKGYLATHADKYRRDPKVSFQQVFLNTKKRGDQLKPDTKLLLKKLRAAGAQADISNAGDPLMLQQAFKLAPQHEVVRQFGEEFTTQLLDLPSDSWQGPISSGYGTHLVYITQRVESTLPPLEDIRQAVIRDWSAEKRKQSNEALYQEWLKGYFVTIENHSITSEEAAK